MLISCRSFQENNKIYKFCFQLPRLIEKLIKLKINRTGKDLYLAIGKVLKSSSLYFRLYLLPPVASTLYITEGETADKQGLWLLIRTQEGQESLCLRSLSSTNISYCDRGPERGISLSLSSTNISYCDRGPAPVTEKNAEQQIQPILSEFFPSQSGIK